MHQFIMQLHKHWRKTQEESNMRDRPLPYSQSKGFIQVLSAQETTGPMAHF